MPPKEPALSTVGMNDGAGKLLPFFMGEQTASRSAIPELAMRLFGAFKTMSIHPKRGNLCVPGAECSPAQATAAFRGVGFGHRFTSLSSNLLLYSCWTKLHQN